jgi:hypothetical protein
MGGISCAPNGLSTKECVTLSIDHDLRRVK